MEKSKLILTLPPSLQEKVISGISDELIADLIATKNRVMEQQRYLLPVALVHLSWDLTHSAHVQYIRTIIQRLREVYNYPAKLLVWVEADVCTEIRKQKSNIYDEQERKYIFENIKWVDKAYIQFEHPTLEQNNQSRPAEIVKYLSPDILISHEEHIPSHEQEEVRQRCKKHLIDLLVIWFDDTEYWQQTFRQTKNRSTTNTVKQIMTRYKWNPRYQ